MTLSRWDPFRELMDVRREMDRLLGGNMLRPARNVAMLGQWAEPSLDVYQKPKEVVVKASLPGVKPEDIEVSINGDTLIIKGETRGEDKIEDKDYLWRERHYGSYFRSVTLPRDLQTDKVEAAFEDGVLTLNIPRAVESKPKTIEVKGKKAIEGKKKTKKPSAAKKKAGGKAIGKEDETKA